MAELQSSTIGGNTVYHQGNDGTNSGLNADLLAGIAADDYCRLDSTGQGFTLNGDLSGWYTIAIVSRARGIARFVLYDTTSGRHQYVAFYASHHYGSSAGYGITVLSTSRFGSASFGGLRIREGGTYDGAMLQVLLTNSRSRSNRTFYLAGDNFQNGGWEIRNWVPAGTDPGGLDNFSGITNTGVEVDLDTGGRNGAVHTTGTLRANGSISKGAGSFDIPHPDPNKSEWRLRHSFVESPTRGDNLYRYQISVENRSFAFKLPEYFLFLNENSQCWIKSNNAFSKGWAQIDEKSNTCFGETTEDGLYDLLIIATRKDEVAVQHWDKLGIEYSNYREPE